MKVLIMALVGVCYTVIVLLAVWGIVQAVSILVYLFSLLPVSVVIAIVAIAFGLIVVWLMNDEC